MSESLSESSLFKICHCFGIRLHSTGASPTFWIQIIVTNLMNLYCIYYMTHLFVSSDAAKKDTLVNYTYWLLELWYINISFYMTYKRADWLNLIGSMTETQKKLFGNSNIRVHFRIATKFVIICCVLSLTMVTEAYLFSTVHYNGLKIFLLPLLIYSGVAKLYRLVGVILVRSCMEVLMDQIRFTRRRINRLDRFELGAACEEIVEIARVCRSLQTSVEAFNKIFGWHLFLLFASYVFCVLANMVVSTNVPMGSILSSVLIAIQILYGLVDTVLILLIALPGDRIEKGREILEQECHEMIFDKLSRSQLKNELLTLSQSIKITNLRITAAEFYDVNKRALLGLASVITTYFIVYLQFKN